VRIIRFLGNVALWLGALLGVAAGGVWVADQLGWVQPLIVISGSMEPNIGTGDLLISRNLATTDVEVGDIVSLHSEMTDKLVTHRVTEVAPNDDGTWTISMKGDANDEPDLETYVVGESVLTPALQIPQAGKVVSKLMEPAVALPILLSLVALLGISLLDEPARAKAGRGRKRAPVAQPDVETDDDITSDDAIGEVIVSEVGARDVITGEVIASSDGITHDEKTGEEFTHDDDTSDDAGQEITRELPVITVDVEPAGFDPIEDLDAALASVGALVGTGIDVPLEELVGGGIDVLVDESVHDLDVPAGDLDVSAGDPVATAAALHDVDGPDDLSDDLADLDSSVGAAPVDDLDNLDDLDAALAAFGIDVGRLPAVSPRRATATDADTDASPGLDPSAGEQSPGNDPERRTDASDLVMSG
jgi:signal peptidase